MRDLSELVGAVNRQAALVVRRLRLCGVGIVRFNQLAIGIVNVLRRLLQRIGLRYQSAGRVVTADSQVSQGIACNSVVSVRIVLVLGTVAPLVDLGGDLSRGVVFSLGK